MRLIGGGMARKMQNLCLPEIFTSHANCTANYPIADAAGHDLRDPSVIPLCDGNSYPCYSLGSGPALRPGTDYLLQLDRGPAAGEPIKPGTKIELRCQERGFGRIGCTLPGRGDSAVLLGMKTRVSLGAGRPVLVEMASGGATLPAGEAKPR